MFCVPVSGILYIFTLFKESLLFGLFGQKMDGCRGKLYVLMREGDNKGSAKHIKSAKITGSGQCRVAKEEMR